MADITMTYASLETTAAQVNTAKSELDSTIALLDSAVKSLEGNWSGASYEAFVNAWQSSKPTMQKLSEAVEAFAPELNATVTKQTELETSSAGKLSGLSF